MPFSHLLLALSVVFVWGTNFVVIKWGLGDFPPFMFAALRFIFSALPWVFFVRRPAVSWKRLAAAGIFTGVGQFDLLFWAMQHDISPGLASLAVQAQVFFTILLAIILNGERMKALQVGAMLLAVLGMCVVGWHGLRDPSSTITLFGLATVLMGAFFWACANTLVRGAGRVDMLAFTIWSSLYAVPPLILVSLCVEGPARVSQALVHANWHGWVTVLWQALGNTLFGFGAWNWLLARHPAATVTPSALLVPVVGMLSSAWLLSEDLASWKLAAALLVMAGLTLNIYAGRLQLKARAL
ncbi:EamA family transporter [Bordetella sp. FB-8]|uniref:EamA family transporter n=1 Tax=Bordetella sp. FB-8 TaxID=1159870 RepID=UPI00037BDDCB|nr:EamA family transporter [Bordetella sp. FB-8]